MLEDGRDTFRHDVPSQIRPRDRAGTMTLVDRDELASALRLSTPLPAALQRYTRQFFTICANGPLEQLCPRTPDCDKQLHVMKRELSIFTLQ
ncbi:hypothetical protein KOW79_016588 [Hemibagrus wyckioides]|uniref:Uncharacterized protein n=1 Tax=Hemibagrus wyckioides TaxID=337641 RepID=A0A9D3SD97_9TELE|nr:hypothetical protein KOW79_016588 [Hemibagrus wyckioides]